MFEKHSSTREDAQTSWLTDLLESPSFRFGPWLTGGPMMQALLPVPVFSLWAQWHFGLVPGIEWEM